MNKLILNHNIQEFINKNLKVDVSSILLKGTSFPNVDTKEIAEQIEAKKRCEKKLPIWFKTNGIYFPNKLNIEQTSSQVTALYKVGLISGDSIVDLTGGFGVDCYFFSNAFKNVEHCEINLSLSAIVTHNYKQLGVTNIKTYCIDGIEFLKNSTKTYDWIYIDPSRRHDSKGKVFFLNDCLPNVPEHLDILFKRSKNVLIKTSPLLDLSVGIDELKHVKTIHVVAINNEVKELLWILEQNFIGDITIKTVNIKPEKEEHFNFKLNSESTISPLFHSPLTYLYEPNSAILKAGGFNAVSHKFKIFKLHKHSHLYTSNELINFPGRSFKIDAVLSYSKKALKKTGICKANITTRNFPETVQQIRKKLNIKDGGSVYLFFTTDINKNKVILVTSKV
ncbi:THUMP-like domain-containing protein [Snuella sedimenti]|uniref:Class I SAM-dependent methyltransferase n=1 Tax=Snuella sedimenti TaxID=2798802 RepID=A0A8J7JAV8_9FLAO|nr:class I SAM-dependent methyltransferase [Snuella sedimenti]MBJ6367669.1 class I SAM-dependent methyltransferase [Snuella sedimenti]